MLTRWRIGPGWPPTPPRHRARFDSADLLLGLLEIDDGMAVRLLHDLGVDPAAVRARLRPRAA